MLSPETNQLSPETNQLNPETSQLNPETNPDPLAPEDQVEEEVEEEDETTLLPQVIQAQMIAVRVAPEEVVPEFPGKISISG